MKLCLACRRNFSREGWECPACGYEPPEQDGIRLFAAREAEAGDGFDERSFEHLPSAEVASFWFRARNRLVLWALETYFPHARSMLEVGCGTGYVLSGVASAFPQIRLVGSELFPAGLATAAFRAPSAELLQADARKLPYSQEFDVVGAFDVLEHIEEDQEVLAELHRAVRPAGGLLVTVPQHPKLWSPVDDYSRHVRRYVRRELVAKLNRAGFDLMRLTSFVTLLLPVMALSRLRQRRSRGFDPLAEYRSPAFVDSALGCVMAAERSLIRAGVSLPSGGSLLAVASRR
ncbi:MAG TPA: class I SAM-dependent methyltransferase [Actinomycetota bacterium]|jgi:SAM-dependent methyltransferase|nr:class I SAM-dependent methyltransferase [Actinomycetota bacterium]